MYTEEIHKDDIEREFSYEDKKRYEEIQNILEKEDRSRVSFQEDVDE